MTNVSRRRPHLLPVIHILLLAGLFTSGYSQDLSAAEDRDWALYGNGNSNQLYSSLARINRDNVLDLELAWRYHTQTEDTFQTNPLVKNGVMYVTTPYNDAVALDAASRREIWRYERLPLDEKCRFAPVKENERIRSCLNGGLNGQIVLACPS